MKSVLQLIDQALDHWIKHEANSIPGEVPFAMQTGRIEDDWVYWEPIDSSVTDEQIAALEKDLALELPLELIDILKHKHFVELHIGEVEIFSMPSTGWQLSISKGLYDSWPSEFIIDKGYFPFASFSDWGLWCFNLNEKKDTGEYPIYLWDHDDAENFQYIASNLKNALNEEIAKNA